MQRIIRAFLAPLAILAVAGTANAAVTANNPITLQLPTRGLVQFLQGTDVAGVYKTLFTAGADGSKCNGMWLTTDDATATHLVTVELVNTAIKYGGTSITTTLGAGYVTNVAAVDFMSNGAWPGLPTDSEGNPYLFMQSGDTLQATFATALTAGKKINLVVNCANF